MSASPERPNPTPGITTTPPELTPAPALPETAGPAETTGYQPLSILAVLGFVVAAGLAVLVAGGAAIALWTRTPLLLPPWLILVAAVAVLVGWIARVQIHNAEGTLGGKWAANWAIGLCVVIAPLYAAYYAATYFAVTSMGQDYAVRWLKLLADGDADAAFWWTIRPGERPKEGEPIRDLLEASRNQMNPTAGIGEVTAFRRSELVRLLNNAGKEAKIDPVNLNNWGFEQGGYNVQGTYKVTGREGSFLVVVAAQGVTATTGELRGRQWHIVQNGSYRDRAVPPELNAEGNAKAQAVVLGRAYLEQLLGLLGKQQLEEAFLFSLPAEERKAVEPAMGRVLAVGLAAGPIPASDPATRRVTAARQAWFGGGRAADDAKFWALRSVRPAVVAAARLAPTQGIVQGPGVGIRWTLGPPFGIPAAGQAEGGIELLGFDVQVAVPPADPTDPKSPAFVIEGLAQVRFRRGPKGTLEPDGLDRVELISGHQAASGQGRPMPGG